MTPDGPKGPRFVFKPGAILLSQMSQRPILPMAYAASRATLFHWDKFVLPWPFSRIVIAIGAPRQVPRTLQPAALAALQKELAADMKKLFGVARDALRASPQHERRSCPWSFPSATKRKTSSRWRAKSRPRSERDYEMIFVDDGSTDETAVILKRLKGELPALRVLRHSFRSGQSAAVASGVRAARAPWVATLDGDGQNDPADIPKLIAARDDPANRNVQLVMGNRKASRKDTAFRKLQSSIANGVRSGLLGDRTRTPAAGSSSFRARCSSSCRASITCIASCRRCSCAMARR